MWSLSYKNLRTIGVSPQLGCYIHNWLIFFIRGLNSNLNDFHAWSHYVKFGNLNKSPLWLTVRYKDMNYRDATPKISLNCGGTILDYLVVALHVIDTMVI